MEKDILAKELLKGNDYEIWRRVQIKKKNEYPVIAEDLWVSKQRAYTRYSEVNRLVEWVYNLRKENERI